MHICAHIYIYIYMHINIYARKHARIYVHIYAYMHAYMLICAHICIYARTHMHNDMHAFMRILEKEKIERHSRDSGVRTNEATQFWHGRSTHEGVLDIFDKIGSIAASHPVNHCWSCYWRKK